MVAFNFKAARRLLLAVALMLAAGVAAAVPQYHLTLDTHGYSGTGWLDLQFNPGLDGARAMAMLSNFSGVLGGAPADVQGGVSGALPGALTFTNSTAFNAFFQSVQLGGVFGFDLELAGTSSVFSVGLYAGDMVTALGNADPFTNSLVAFNLGQGMVISDPALVSVGDPATVPEPATGWLVAGALGALALVRKRR